MRAFAIGLKNRNAFFGGPGGYVELDLANGRPRSSGELPTGLRGVDLETRRLVTLHQHFRTAEDHRAGADPLNYVRVFEMK